MSKSKMKKLMTVNRNGTVLFKSKAALRSYINDSIGKYQDKLLNQYRDEIYQSAFMLSALLSLESLNLEFGFGDKRLLRFLERYNSIMESLSDDYVEYDDLYEEYKHLIDIVNNSDSNKS